MKARFSDEMFVQVAQRAKEKLLNALTKPNVQGSQQPEQQQVIPDKRRFNNGRVFTCK